MAGLRKPGRPDQPSPRPRGEPEEPFSDTESEEQRSAQQQSGPVAETSQETTEDAALSPTGDSGADTGSTEAAVPAADGSTDSAAATPNSGDDAGDDADDGDESGGAGRKSASSGAEAAAEPGDTSSGPRRKRRSTGDEKPVAPDDVVGTAAPGTPPTRLTRATARKSRGRLSAKSAYIVSGGLVLVAAVFSAGAWFAGSQYSDVSNATGNSALINVDETQQAKKAMSKGAERLFSFDYRDIDKTKDAADDLLANKDVKHKYDTLMGEVERLAPKQKAVVSVDATESAVVNLHDDQAKVMVYVDQTSKRKKSKGTASGGAALWLTGELHGDEWKVVDMDTYSSGNSNGQQGNSKEQQSEKQSSKDDSKGSSKDKDKKDSKDKDEQQGDDGGDSESSGN